VKLSHFIVCGLAACVIPAVALAKDPVSGAPSSSTLFPGVVDLPVADGSRVPDNCEFPSTLSGASGYELACVVQNEDVDMEYIAWLGRNGWRRGNEIMGGFEAVRETSNGCEQVLNIFPHGEDDETTPGMWFALQREPNCTAAHTNTAQ
jgi:hypothetical protein